MAEEASTLEEFKRKFYIDLIQYDKEQRGYRRKPWTRKRIIEIIDLIKSATESTKRKPSEYYWISKYEIITVDNEEQLILKRRAPYLSSRIIRILPREEYFDTLLSIHNACEHGARDKILFDVKKKYYIPKKAVEIFVYLCPGCSDKRRLQKQGIVRRQTVVPKFNIAGQVDLIDFQSRPDGEFNWILNYQDDATNFISLRPLRTNDAVEMSRELIKIFLTFGAPTILQLNTQHQFAARLTENLKAMWPELVVGYKNTEKTGNNQEIRKSLLHWMLENHSNRWSVGCFIIQYEMNNVINSDFGRSPYNIMFSDPKNALSGSNLPTSVFPTDVMDGDLKIEPKQEPIDNVPGQSSDDDC